MAEEQKDRVEQLLDALNEIDGLSFTEDAWVEKAPEPNYGVIELEGESGGDWADGRKTAQKWQIRITIYVSGGSHKWILAVQEVLNDLKLPYTAPQRNYLHDINKVSWSWLVKTKMNGLYDKDSDAIYHARGRSF